MQVAISLFADASRFRDMTSAAQVLDYLEDRFRSAGATRFLATGLPLPGRPLAPLLVRASWGDSRGDRSSVATVRADDAVLQATLHARFPFEWPARFEGLDQESQLVNLAGGSGDLKLIVVPVVGFPPYQGCVLGAGTRLAFTTVAMVALGFFCHAAFERLLDLNVIHRERPGDLSTRERRVIELSAVGKTAGEIAELLSISQRTVHAHLQNASEKLRARNKTHTVVEALRYCQIEI